LIIEKDFINSPLWVPAGHHAFETSIDNDHNRRPTAIIHTPIIFKNWMRAELCSDAERAVKKKTPQAKAVLLSRINNITDPKDKRTTERPNEIVYFDIVIIK
jgi:hypothetical protein